MDAEQTKDCDICLSALPAQSTLTWDCQQCTWCFECISSGITSCPQKSDWPQNWCGHSSPTPIPLKTILEKAKKHIAPHIYTKWFEKQEQWSQIKCPHCCRWTHSDHITEGRILECPTCNKSVCIECGKLAHEGQCKRTRKEDLKAVLNALRHEGAAMCPRCGFVAGRAKDGCNQITCPKPCSQVFCFKCSRDWKLCRGMCKGGGAAEVLEKATQAESPTEVFHVKEENKNNEAFAESEEDTKTKTKGETKKRAPSSDPLFQRFTKKAKTEVEFEDEEDKDDILGVSPDASDDEEDKVAHDDDNEAFEYDFAEDDEYGSDDGEEGENDEEEEDQE